MEDVLGGRTDPERFAGFLADWEAILGRRVDAAVAAFAAVDGVRGLLLAGSVGRGEPWPLSDIDILPIYGDDRVAAARAEIERRRTELLAPWNDEGWWTGLDIGRLAFARGEVDRVLGPDGPGPMEALRDDRWYHALDKGYQGRPVYDPDGLVAPLARWFTEHRFDRSVVRFRSRRARDEVVAAQRRIGAMIGGNVDPAVATTEPRSAVKWFQAWVMEGWGERDASLGRIGTRFERWAVAHGLAALPAALNDPSDLDEASVERRMVTAPDWVGERHDRSWQARRHVGEAVTRLQDARDTLRVCSQYAMRRVSGPPFPVWLAIPPTVRPIQDKADRLAALAGPWFAEAS